MGDQHQARVPESVGQNSPIDDDAVAAARPLSEPVNAGDGLDRALVQAKLSVGPAGDRYEQEADAVAARVVRSLRAGTVDSVAGADVETGGRVARSASASVPHEEAAPRIGRIQRAATVGLAGGAVDVDTERAIQSSRGGGRPMPDEARSRMEGAFGADFSEVRIHAGSKAAELNNRIQAEAFTVGSDVYFRNGMPDASSSGGQELLAHELTHVVQQGATGETAQRRIQRKAKTPHTPADGLEVLDDWVAYSGGDTPKRSPLLKQVDAAVAKYVGGYLTIPTYPKGNLEQLTAINNALDAWRAKKKGKVSVRDIAVADLRAVIGQSLADFGARQAQADVVNAAAEGLHDQFAMLDNESSKFAKKNTYDVKPDRFLPQNQSPALMAHTKKNDDGTLTEEGLDALDEQQIADRDALIAKARGQQITVADNVTPEDLRALMAADVNPLSGETALPELAAVSDPTGEAPGEITETKAIAGSTFEVTYDPSDPGSAIRLGALDAAVTLINATQAHVPDLDVYFPRAGRTVEVDAGCQVTVKKGIADAVFYAPAFFAVSSANVGNPKDLMAGTEYHFLSTALSAADGFTTALRNSIIHELGHACHYENDRSGYYNLNFANFSGQHNGRSYNDISMAEVSGYASNPREMVAEVFLAAVVGGKNFSDVVWEMYHAFGGAPVV